MRTSSLTKLGLAVVVLADASCVRSPPVAPASAAAAGDGGVGSVGAPTDAVLSQDAQKLPVAPDLPTVADMMEAYSLDAVDHAASCGVTLDYSPESVQRVEEILTALADALAVDRPSDEDIWTMCKAYGGYVGEVLRRTGGGEWAFDVETEPGSKLICLRKGERCIWPPVKVYKRLMSGAEDNVWRYFQALVDEYWK